MPGEGRPLTTLLVATAKVVGGQAKCGHDMVAHAGSFGTLRSNSASQALALPSDGARQSPRGDNEPPALTLGPFGIAERLNWLNAKKRRRNTSSHLRMVGRS